MSTTIIVDRETRAILEELTISTDMLFSRALGLAIKTVAFSVTTISVSDYVYAELAKIKKQQGFSSINSAVRFAFGLQPLPTRHPERLNPVRRIPVKTLIYVNYATYAHLVDNWLKPDDVIRQALGLERRAVKHQEHMPMMMSRYEVGVSLEVRNQLHRIRDRYGLKNTAQAADYVFGL